MDIHRTVNGVLFHVVKNRRRIRRNMKNKFQLFFVLPLVFTLFSSFHCLLLYFNSERSDILSEISEGNKNITVVGVSQCWIVYYTQLHHMNIDIEEQKNRTSEEIHKFSVKWKNGDEGSVFVTFSRFLCYFIII